MKLIKAALIGAGGIGNTHSEAYRGIPDVKVTAVADVCRDRAAKIAGVHGAAVYGSMDEVLEKETPDLIDICTPTSLHAEMAVKALDHKAHVLCEKPMAINVDEGRKMLEAARENDRYLMIGQVIRFWPEYVYLKRVFDEGTYGDLNQLLLSRIGQRPKWSWKDWMMDREKSGRAPLDLHIHDTDFVMYLLGRPKAVHSSGSEKGNMSYILTQYLYEDRNRAVAAEGAWYEQPLPFSMSFRAVFDKAILDFRDNKLAVYPNEGETKTIDFNEIKKASTGINLSSVGAYENEIRYFIDCIRKGRSPEIASPESTLECLDITLKEIESAGLGKTVEL